MARELNTELNGIAPSLHTPFNDDQSIDYNGNNIVVNMSLSDAGLSFNEEGIITDLNFNLSLSNRKGSLVKMAREIKEKESVVNLGIPQSDEAKAIIDSCMEIFCKQFICE